MTTEEKERILRDALYSLNPSEIRKAGEQTGHPVYWVDDAQVMFAAAEMILFYMPDAPDEVKERAMAIFGVRNIFAGGF